MTNGGRLRAVLAALLCLFNLTACAPSQQTIEVNIAYARVYAQATGAGAVGFEKRQVFAGDGTVLYRRLLAELLKTPSNPYLRSPFPEGTALTALRLEDGTLYADYTDALLTLSEAERVVALCCVVKTLSLHDEIRGVIVTAGGQTLHDGALTPDSFVTATDELRFVTRRLTLYYPNETHDGLSSTVVSVKQCAADEPAEAVVALLISGVTTDAGVKIDFVAEDTVIGGVRVRDGICTVELSQAFLFGDVAAPDGRSLTAGALVASLKALPNVQSVAFLIDGEPTQLAPWEN